MNSKFRNIIFIAVVFIVFGILWAFVGDKFLVTGKIDKEQIEMIREIYPVLHTDNIDKNIDFYKKLGFKVLMRHPQTGSVQTALLEIDRSKLLLKKPDGTKRCLTEIYLDVEGIEEVYEEMNENFKIEEDINKTDYGTKEFSVEDLDGNTLYFSEMIY